MTIKERERMLYEELADLMAYCDILLLDNKDERVLPIVNPVGWWTLEKDIRRFKEAILDVYFKRRKR